MRRALFTVLLLFLSACAPKPGKASAPASGAASPQAPTNQAELHALLQDAWAKEGASPAPAVNDAEFLRRASLDLIGRIPTREEARAFLDDPAPDKRATLVDRLLASPDYAEHWADVYLGLTVSAEVRRIAKLESPRAYFVESFAHNKPYDQLARELLTATGDLQDNGAGAFLVSQAKSGGPEKVAGSTARLFLGLQLQCAQCHNHPYDARYQQEDFYGLVGYFVRTRGRQDKTDKTISIVDLPRGEAKMKRPGSTEEEKVAPSFLGRPLDQHDDETRREALARAVVSSDLFAKAMVNRTWAQLFGRGILEPWDDLGGENDQTHPPLLSFLAKQFVASGYDSKALLKSIVLSEAYARSSRGAPTPDDPQRDERVFARAALRPLRPEQLFRSLLLATKLDESAKARASEDKLAKALERARREYLFVFGDDEMAEVSTFDGNTPQSLLLLNGELTNRGVLARPGSALREILDTYREPKDRLEALFLTAYARGPSPEEIAALLPTLPEKGNQPYEDLFFALLTSTEFLTNH